MRAYTVFYLTEENDECVDREVNVTCANIYCVLPQFALIGIVHKRVTGIQEKPKHPKNDT